MKKIKKRMLATVHSNKLFPGLWRQVAASLLQFGEQETYRLCHILVFVQFWCDPIKITCSFENVLAHSFSPFSLPKGQETIDSRSSLAHARVGTLASFSMIVQTTP